MNKIFFFFGNSFRYLLSGLINSWVLHRYQLLLLLLLLLLWLLLFLLLLLLLLLLLS